MGHFLCKLKRVNLYNGNNRAQQLNNYTNDLSFLSVSGKCFHKIRILRSNGEAKYETHYSYFASLHMLKCRHAFCLCAS